MASTPLSVPVVFWDRSLMGYNMANGHLMRPERAAMAVSLLTAYGLFSEGLLSLERFRPARGRDLVLVHDRSYLRQLRDAGRDPEGWPAGVGGINTPDVLAFPDMFEAARAVCGASVAAVARAVAGGQALAPAGGMHHAHRSSAAGFCLLNDAAVAIAAALRDNWGLRVAYVDIDAHHGDGVQEAFWNDPRVLTVSLHCSGRHLYPGTGWPSELGGPAARGSAANVAMPPGADDACYRRAWEGFVEPLLRAWRPDVIVAQLGADALATDAKGCLGLTLRGHEALSSAALSLSRSVCGGRFAGLGGGGYGYSLGAPRAWAMAAARLAGTRLPDVLPGTWLPAAKAELMATMGLDVLPPMAAVSARATVEECMPRYLRDDGTGHQHYKDPGVLLAETEAALEESRAAVFPFWGLR